METKNSKQSQSGSMRNQKRDETYDLKEGGPIISADECYREYEDWTNDNERILEREKGNEIEMTRAKEGMTVVKYMRLNSVKEKIGMYLRYIPSKAQGVPYRYPDEVSEKKVKMCEMELRFDIDEGYFDQFDEYLYFDYKDYDPLE